MAVVLGNAGVLKPGKWRWLRAIGWMAVLFIALSIVFGLALGVVASIELSLAGVPFSSNALSKAAPAYGTIPIIIGLVAMLGLYAFAVRWGEKRPATEIGLGRLFDELPTGFLVGLVLMTLTVGMLWLFGFDHVVSAPVTRIAMAANATLQSGVLEETLFRLVVFRLAWRAFGIWPALALSALLFGAVHLANPNATPFAALCIALEAGILLAAFYVLTGRAWMSMGVHAGWNFSQGWIYGAAVSGTSGFAGGPLMTTPVKGVSAILSGGRFGPEASLPALLVCTAAGLYVLRRAWRQGQFVAAD